MWLKELAEVLVLPKLWFGSGGGDELVLILASNGNGVQRPPPGERPGVVRNDGLGVTAVIVGRNDSVPEV